MTLGVLVWMLVVLQLHYGGDGAATATSVKPSSAPAARSRVHAAAFTITNATDSSEKLSSMFLKGNMACAAKSIDLPYFYPMHRHLPANGSAVAAAIEEKQMRRQASCWATAHESPLFPSPPSHEAALLRPVHVEAADAMLRQEYFFARQTPTDSMGSGTFFSGYDTPVTAVNETVAPWWVTDKFHHLPCTVEVQKRLYEYQNKASCGDRKFLLSDLKEGGHGLGSSLIVVAFDFLSALRLGRSLLIGGPRFSKKWQFSAQGCWQERRRSLDCFYLPPSRCQFPGGPVQVVRKGRDAARSSARVIRKYSVDIPGLDRSTLPSEEAFFGPGHRQWDCYPKYQQWLQDPANVAVYGTFESGLDTRLSFMLAQAFTYLTRAPQPWFQAMIEYHLAPLGIATSHAMRAASYSGAYCMFYVQDRGEVAKMREYYNVFGCHTVGLSLYRDYVCAIGNSFGGNSSQTPCRVYISGGTPHRSYLWLKREFENASYEVLSTWNLSTLNAGSESMRWGASSPAASWVDLYAGVASTNWVCVVQSNWCRMINFLRLTHGRVDCGFVDIGAMLLTSIEAREKYCVVSNFPTKPFSNVIRR
ncbi:hypothetical protein TraAM80_04934 [Trypanosoma rangeli]|uniref:Membrane-associated protein n=1 Tax=Trypanosoma rangeli TaxID=5698 RepID=A0A3S5IR60_TRYRA|nr:uncharacterized protein TraAM80_04934 [Trypanosoma rangeli]RNF04639.1 hypothetical protein TraAM80_04934 [Trypanosoma rangeli]|eukprot:RNF04639.1 hypothetical protein TraAM80_04934 [Trypanosoma rangeli]